MCIDDRAGRQSWPLPAVAVQELALEHKTYVCMHALDHTHATRAIYIVGTYIPYVHNVDAERDRERERALVGGPSGRAEGERGI